MKKILTVFAVLLLISTSLLAACGGSDGEESLFESKIDLFPDQSGESSESGDESVAESVAESIAESKPEENDKSEASKEDNNDESSKEEAKEIAKLPTEYIEGELNVMAASFSEKPYFALVGRCADGATVTGEAGGETVVSESYKGWYSLRLKCSGSAVDVKLSQTVDGKAVGKAQELRIKPVMPGSEMWPVVTGGDFQFFFQKMLPDFQGKNIPSNFLLNNLEVRTRNKLNLLRESKPDAEIIYLLVPSAMSVYPELVPEQYKPCEGPTKYDYIVEKLKAGGATVIDLKSAFEQHKNDEMPLYYKLDSHWSDYGAFVAYTELFNHISKTFPDAAPLGIDEFNWNPNYYNSGDMSYYLAMSQSQIKEYSYFRTFKNSVPEDIFRIDRYRSKNQLTYSDDVTYEKIINTGYSNLPKCVVMRDSYSTQMYDILAERTSSTHYLGMWNYTWDKNQMRYESPDYVIYIVAEWNLDAVLNG